MRSVAILSGGAVALAVLAACSMYAPAGTPAARAAAYETRTCFYAPHVRGFRDGPGDSIIVNSNSREYFVLEPYHRCGNINVRLNVAIRTRGSGYVCEGQDADLYVPGVQGPEFCPVRAIRKLSPAEVQALRSRRR